ncbi:ATP-binding protein [Candidatus Roizmanbacteria bacterium]|nr:ATP-binding protein [Candidatus Roizmanbacteria bacterium]
MIYPRKLKKKILRELSNDLTIVITGMRRVGKTFLLQDLFDSLETKNKILLDLEKPENRQLFSEESYDAVIRNFELLGLSLVDKIPGKTIKSNQRAWIFLDEIQYFKKTPSVIKYLSDHYWIKFIVTGSSSFYLKNLFSESLSGRKIVFNLTPLDFGEFLTFKGKKNLPVAHSFKDLTKLNTKMVYALYQALFTEYLEAGGFPQAVMIDSPERRKTLLYEILHSYLTIDVRTLSDLKGVEELEKLIYLLPSRIGQKLDVSKISAEVGISRQTVNNYLSFLEDTFIIDRITPFSKSPDREISSVPKLYFIDVGLGAVLSGISEGQRLENVANFHLSRHYDLNYYQRKSGAEIDFILDKKIGVEIKTFASDSDYRRLYRLAQDINIKEYYLFSQNLGKERNQNILPVLLLGFLE